MKLPASKDPDAFEKFMREEYFPATSKQLTRIGGVVSMQLVQGGTDDIASTHDFFWLVEWSGLSHGAPMFNEEVAAKLKSFGVKPKRLGFFHNVASWSREEK